MDANSIFRKAKRSQLKLKLLLGGPSGAGKTYSSLLLADGFMGDLEKVVVIDTEKSADLYEDINKKSKYTVVDFEPPFDPRRLIKLIDICVDNGFEFIIIDSLTPFWDGEGGLLDIHAAFGNRFSDWQKSGPIWNNLLQKIVHTKANFIVCTRKKQEYTLEQQNGKMTVQKMGLKNIIREGGEYEFSVALDVDINHNATVNKDRTGLFEEITPCVLNKEHGAKLKKWCNGN